MAQEVQAPSPAGAEDDSPKSQESRPTKTLPTDRITFERQLELLRAYAAASEPSGKPVSVTSVADIVKMHASTVSLANGFFSEVRFIQKADGKYIPATEVFNYHHAFQWKPDTASHKLSPLVAESWFAKALLPKLSFRALNEDEAVQTLADTASAAPRYRKQLQMLIEYLGAAGLVRRDGDLIRHVRSELTNGERAALAMEEAQSVQPKASIVTTFTTQPTEGTVQFHVSVRVDMAEFATWRPERIAAFFSGIAQVLSAKAEVEKGEGQG